MDKAMASLPSMSYIVAEMTLQTSYRHIGEKNLKKWDG